MELADSNFRYRGRRSVKMDNGATPRANATSRSGRVVQRTFEKWKCSVGIPSCFETVVAELRLALPPVYTVLSANTQSKCYRTVSEILALRYSVLL